jgi:hypothetical protein
MYVAHVSLAGSGRQSAQETHLVAGIVEKQELYAATPMENGRSRKGVKID